MKIDAFPVSWFKSINFFAFKGRIALVINHAERFAPFIEERFVGRNTFHIFSKTKLHLPVTLS